MKVAVCNTHYSKGGAAKATQRIAQGLCFAGLEVSFLSIDDSEIKKNRSFFLKTTKPFWSRLEQYPKLLSSKNFSTPFSTSKYSLKYLNTLKKIEPDVVHLHYVNNGLLSIKDIGEIDKPIVWTLHDSWTFTGGCHLPMVCERYKEKCGNCPIIAKGKENDLSRYVWEMKNKYWKDLDITIVSPSKWLAERAKQSSLLKDKRIEVIPNPLDTNIFKPIKRDDARNNLGLKKDKKYILFGAVNAVEDRNKGFNLLKEALENLKSKNIELVVFGSNKDKKIDIDIPVKNMGFIYDEEELAKIYSACDVTVVPSRSENQPNIAIESLSCGTPVVGFDIDGLKEVIQKQELGVLANSFETSDLGNKIIGVLEGSTDRDKISSYIQKNFSIEGVGNEYKGLFEGIDI